MDSINKAKKFLDDMNGWKTIIVIVFAAGLNYAGIMNQLKNNHEEFVSFQARQEKWNDKQETKLDSSTLQLRQDINRLQKEIFDATR